MGENNTQPPINTEPNKSNVSNTLLTASIVLSSFSTQPSGIISSLLLIEIGSTFSVPVGITGQMQTIASVVGVIAALSLGIFSVKFSPRSILLVGSLLLILASVGCAYAWDFPSLLLIFSLTGVGIVMITPMVNTIIGHSYSVERRAKILGLSAAGTSVAYLLCSPLVSLISGVYGWRLVFMGLMLPVSAIGLLFAVFGIPRQPSKNTVGKTDWLSGYRSVLSRRSTVFCLIGTMLCWTSFLGSLTYMASFYRQQFLIELGWVSILFSVFALSKTLGHLTIGGLVAKIGRKTMVVASVFSMSLFIMGYLYSPLLWVSIPIACISCVLAGYMHSSVDSLNLEQVPEQKGPMMSLSYAFNTMGRVLGAGIGGYALVTGGYGALAGVLGVVGLASCILFYFFAVDIR